MLQEPESPRDEEAADVPGEEESTPARLCPRCNMLKPLSHFMKRTGKRSGKNARRGMCRACRKKTKKLHRLAAPEAPPAAPVEAVKPAETAAPGKARKKKKATLPVGTGLDSTGLDSTGTAGIARPAAAASGEELQAAPPMRRLSRRPLPEPPPKPPGPDASVLRPTREGIIRMRGHTDKGRRWVQETDLETASVLVREFAAVVVNAHTIRRLYSNKKFKRYILMRDQYTCYFCGEYGDTIDHLLPRSRGGHTTPMNCVCACNLCNQSKANRSLEDFMEGAED